MINYYGIFFQNLATLLAPPVLVKNFLESPVWLKGTIHSVRGALTFDMQIDDGRITRRHVDHIRFRKPPADDQNNETADDDFPFTPPQDTSNTMASRNEHSTPNNQEPQGNSETTDRNTDQLPNLRRSIRERQPPDRLQVWS